MPVDIGLYNHVKKSLKDGESKDSIRNSLIGAKWSEGDINEVFMLIERGALPVMLTPKDAGVGIGSASADVSKIVYKIPDRPASINMICGYYFVTWIVFAVGAVVSFFVDIPTGVGNIIAWAAWNAWMPWFVIGTALLQAASIIGLFTMRRWGFFLYVVTTFAAMAYSVLSMLRVENPNYLAFVFSSGVIVPIITLAVGVSNFKILKNSN